MSANSGSLKFSDDFTKQLFWIKKPASNKSREIRDAILGEYFGYTDADITELTQKNDKLFWIREDQDKDWASVAQVRGWKTDLKGGISIPIPQKVIDEIITFREQRALFEAFKVSTFITDPATRKAIKDGLESILLLSGEPRTNALNNLMVTVAGSQSSRVEIYKAFRFLTNESGYKNNPFLPTRLSRNYFL